MRVALKTEKRAVGKGKLRKPNGTAKAVGKRKKVETLTQVKTRFAANREAMLKRAAINGMALFGKTEI